MSAVDTEIAERFAASNAAKGADSPAMIFIRSDHSDYTFSLDNLDPYLSTVAKTHILVPLRIHRGADLGPAIQRARRSLGSRQIIDCTVCTHGTARGKLTFPGGDLSQVTGEEFEGVTGDLYFLACHSLGLARKVAPLLAQRGGNVPQRVWGAEKEIMSCMTIFSSGPVCFSDFEGQRERNLFWAVSRAGDLMEHPISPSAVVQLMEARVKEDPEDPMPYDFLSRFLYSLDRLEAHKWALLAPTSSKVAPFHLSVFTQNREARHAWIAQAAERGHFQSKIFYSKILAREGKYEEALREISDVLPHAPSFFEVEVKYLEILYRWKLNRASPEELREAFQFFQSRISTHSDALAFTAYCYLEGVGVAQDKGLAACCFYRYLNCRSGLLASNERCSECFSMLKQLCAQGVPEALYYLAKLLFFGSPRLSKASIGISGEECKRMIKESLAKAIESRHEKIALPATQLLFEYYCALEPNIEEAEKLLQRNGDFDFISFLKEGAEKFPIARHLLERCYRLEGKKKSKRIIHREIEELGVGQEGSSDFLAGARGIAASQDPKRGRKI